MRSGPLVRLINKAARLKMASEQVSSGGVAARHDAASHHVVGGGFCNPWPSFKQQQGLLGVGRAFILVSCFCNSGRLSVSPQAQVQSGPFSSEVCQL